MVGLSPDHHGIAVASLGVVRGECHMGRGSLVVAWIFRTCPRLTIEGFS